MPSVASIIAALLAESPDPVFMCPSWRLLSDLKGGAGFVGKAELSFGLLLERLGNSMLFGIWLFVLPLLIPRL